MTDIDNWIVQVRKGVLELCILNALEAGECYGYELTRKLAGVSGLGITEGTLYPLLSRLRAQGLINSRLQESSEGPARKYYFLTDQGRQRSVQMNAYLDMLVSSTQRLRGETDASG